MPTVEFFGAVRLRANCASITVEAETIREALQQAESQIPELQEYLLSPERLGKAHSLSLNGDRFVADLSFPLRPTDALLVLSADPGG